MSHVQFTTLIRLPFVRGHFEDPPHAQWDAAKDKQLWKVISKSSKTSDLNWVELADRFQVPPTFLLQQAAWLYERHLDHVRDQMKRVSGSNPGASTLTATGGVAMLRTASGGTASPPLSRTPSTNTITQSRAMAQPSLLPHVTRSTQRAEIITPKYEGRHSPAALSPYPSLEDDKRSPSVLESSSSSSSSSSDADHPAHRSQLFKRPPRFRGQRTKNLRTFGEDAESREIDDNNQQGPLSLPFAAPTRTAMGTEQTQNIQSRVALVANSKSSKGDASRDVPPRQGSAGWRGQSVKDKSSSVANATPDEGASVSSPTLEASASPQSSDHADADKLTSPRQRRLRRGKEGSEGTPSMGSSFSDIDDAGISQSALEEALLSNMQHGRMTNIARGDLFTGVFSLPPHTPIVANHYMQSQQAVYAPKAQPTPMDIPIILVHDHTQEPILTMRYVNGANDLDFESVYKSIKSLARHAGCLHRESPNHWPCPRCAHAFTTQFWAEASHLLDYFADFLIHDNGRMASLWFHLFDTWHQAHTWFPRAPVPDTSNGVHDNDSRINHEDDGRTAARTFTADLLATLQLFDTVLHGPRARHIPREPILYPSVPCTPEIAMPSGTETETDAVRAHPWVSGLKPWEQFLLDDDEDDEDDEDKESSEHAIRYIPMAAIGIMKAHTERARRLAQDMDCDADALRAFDQESLVFSRPRAAAAGAQHPPGGGYASRMGTATPRTYRLINGASRIPRNARQGGSQSQSQGLGSHHHPFSFLDDFVGRRTGVEAYAPVSGGQDGQGDDNLRVFDMWACTPMPASQQDPSAGFTARGLLS
ncbi:hypothetical protein ACEQ8H_008295 [Pleosporales sp. CAS-2024a]